MSSQLMVCSGKEQLAQQACDWLLRLIGQCHRESDRCFYLALSGGSTPKRLYELLAELPVGTVDWERVVLIWGDERNVDVASDESNFRMVRESLLDRIKIPEQNVLGVPEPGGSPAAAASNYELLLKKHFSDAMPRFDCVLLGMGDDVHTASLFPETAALEENDRWVIENYVEKLDCWRITLTANCINAAQNVAFLISGQSKQDALQKLWHGPMEPLKYPSQLIQPTAGQLWFLLDQDALGEVAPPANASLINCG